MSAGAWLPSPVRSGASVVASRITASDPGGFLDGEPWIGEIDFTNPGTSTPTDLTDSRLFIQFAVGDATDLTPIQTCDSAASDGSLIIADPANGKVIVTARPEARTWKAPYFGNGLPPLPTIIYGDVYRQVSGGEPIGLTRLFLRVVRSTGAPVGPPPVLPIGHIIVAASVTGALSVDGVIVSLAGAIPASADVEGAITATPAQTITLSGAISATATLGGGLAVTPFISLSGTVTSGADVRGSLAVSVWLAGDIAAGAAVTGALSSIPAVAISGAIPPPAGVSGTPSVSGMYVGNIVGGGTVTGAVSISVSLTGSVPATGAVTGALSSIAPANLNGTIPAPPGAQGSATTSSGLVTARKGRLMAALAA